MNKKEMKIALEIIQDKVYYNMQDRNFSMDARNLVLEETFLEHHLNIKGRSTGYYKEHKHEMKPFFLKYNIKQRKK